MSIRYWFTVIAFGLVAFAGNGVAQDKVESTVQIQPIAESSTTESGAADDDNRPEDQYSPITILPLLQGIESAIRDLIAEEDEIERERQRDREERDLGAQEAMAMWAFWMFVATATTVVLTIAALVAIIRTLHHTRRAADYAEGMLDEAKNTTAAAQETTEVTRSIGKAQTRAYLQFEYCGFDYVRTGDGDGIKIRGKISNHGQSPAYDINIGGLVSETMPPIVEEVDPRIDLNLIISYLAPKVERGTINVTIPFRTFMEDDAEGEEFWCLIVIRSRDIFDETGYSYFRGKFIDQNHRPLNVRELIFAARENKISLAWS